MNSCILMAEIVKNPELRYTPDNQTPIAEMHVQFLGLRAEDPPSTLKVVGWGNLAGEIKENYHEGDRIVIEGRLNMNTIERPEGFKEKRAELTASRIHKLGADTNRGTVVPFPVEETSKVVPLNHLSAVKPSVGAKKSIPLDSPQAAFESPAPKIAPLSAPVSEKDLDDIPF